MEVESKFSIGDKVWCIYSNKVLCQDVTGVSILLLENAEPVINYTLHFDHDYEEKDVYATKEELLKSL